MKYKFCELIRYVYYKGISFYLVNLLTYVIFHDLFGCKHQALFLELRKLFEFIDNFIIYCHLCPDTLKFQLIDSQNYFEIKKTLTREYDEMQNFTLNSVIYSKKKCLLLIMIMKDLMI